MSKTINIEDYINDAEVIVKYLCNTTKMWHYYSDLRANAMLSLVQANETFDPTLSDSFKSYAKCKVYQATVDEMRKMFPAQRDVINIKKQIASFESGNVALSDEQIAAKLDMSLTQFYSAKYKSIDRLIQCPDIAVLADIEYDAPDTNNDILVSELFTTLKHNKVETQVIKEIYINGLDQREVSKTLGISEHRVSRIHSKALDKMRATMSIAPAEKATRRSKKGNTL